MPPAAYRLSYASLRFFPQCERLMNLKELDELPGLHAWPGAPSEEQTACARSAVAIAEGRDEHAAAVPELAVGSTRTIEVLSRVTAVN